MARTLRRSQPTVNADSRACQQRKPPGNAPDYPETLGKTLCSIGESSTVWSVVGRQSSSSVSVSTRVLMLVGLFLGGMCCARAEGSCELGPLVFGKKVWETHIHTFYEDFRDYRFRWADSSKTVAYFHGKRLPLTSYGKRLSAASVLFRDKHVGRIELLAYDEAIDGKIPRPEFEHLFTQIRETVGMYSGEGNPGISVSDTATGTRRELWVNATTAFFLEYRYQSVAPQFARQFRGDFIRLTTAPSDEASALRSEAKPKVPRLGKLRENVRRSGNVQLIENIPMCLKGEASSSEAATAEMLFAYLQMPIDQREIAATMGADSPREGPFAALRGALDKLAPPGIFRRSVLREFDWRGWQRLVSDYNRNARIAGRPLLDPKGGYDPDVTLRQMDLESLKRSLAQEQSITSFRRSVMDHVARGIPILWGVQLGILPEDGIPLSYHDSADREIGDTGKTPADSHQPAARATPVPQRNWVGKHMRLIVGYDAGRQEVLFSDPWGEKHANKRMAVGDANTITLSLYVVQPKF